jgi:hypothetical protein
MSRKGIALIIIPIALFPILFLSLYALDDYIYTKECEGVPETSYLAQSTFKNEVVNLLGGGLPLNFPWTRYPLRYDLNAFFELYKASLTSHFKRFWLQGTHSQ